MDRPLIEPGVAQVNDELEVGFDADFEYRWSVAERFGRAFLLVVMLAGIAGVLGSGPLDHASIGTVASGGRVDYQPVAASMKSTMRSNGARSTIRWWRP